MFTATKKTKAKAPKIEGKVTKKIAQVASEDAEQVAVVNWLRAKGALVFHIPNGMKSGPVTGARFKRLGVLAGVPDLCFVLHSGRVVWIEMKKIKGKVSKEQIAVHEQMINLGHIVVIGYGAKDAIKKIIMLDVVEANF